MLTFWAQNKGNLVIPMRDFPFYARIQNAVISYVSYLGKTFWPVDLAVFYPYKISFPAMANPAFLLYLNSNYHGCYLCY